MTFPPYATPFSLFAWGYKRMEQNAPPSSPEPLPISPKYSSQVCVLIQPSVSRRGHKQSRTKYNIPGIVESSLFSVAHAVASVFPSLLIIAVTDRAPIEDNAHQLSGGQWDCCRQTDMQDSQSLSLSQHHELALWPQPLFAKPYAPKWHFHQGLPPHMPLKKSPQFVPECQELAFV